MATPKTDIRFWLSDEPHSTIFDHIKRCRTTSHARRQSFALATALYDDVDTVGVSTMFGWDSARELSPALSMNCVRPNVDTLTTQITKARPLPFPVTDDGSATAQKRARQLGKAIEGQFIESRIFEKSFHIVRDGVLHGTGFAYVYRVADKIKFDHVFPWEIEVDARDALYGEPRTLYLTRVVDKLVLQDMFPRYKKEIEGSDSWMEDFFSRTQVGESDSVIVVEAWHLPSGPNAKDGWHYITVSNQVLVKEKYKYDHFPIIPYYVMPPTVGYFGSGFARMLLGVQYTVNVLASRCQKSAELAPSYLMVPRGGDIQVDQLDNSEWPIIEHNQGFVPSALQPEPFNPQLWDFTKTVFNMSYDLTGVSQTAAESDLPKALKEASGVALRMHNENRSERFHVASKCYERFCIDVAERLIDLWEEIVEDGGKVKIKSPVAKASQRVFETIDYKKIRMDKESYTLAMFPTTMLSREPAMRSAEVESWVNAGWISPDDARVLLDFPDLDKFNALHRAQYEVVDLALEKMLDEEVPLEEAYTPPEPYWNLRLVLQRALATYMQAQSAKADEERLQLVRDFIADTQELLQQVNTPPTPPGAAAPPPEAPPMMPGAPPVPPGLDPGMGMPVDPNAGLAGPAPAPGAGGGMTPTDLMAAINSGQV